MKNQKARFETRQEVHYGKQVLRCYTQRPASLYRMLQQAVDAGPAREALVCGQTRLSWLQLQDRIAGIAAGFAEWGIRQGDRVALLLGNRIEFVEAALAASMLGAIIVPISMREQTPGIAHALNDSGAAMLIYEEEMSGRLPPMRDVPGLRVRIAAGAAGGSASFDALRESKGCVPVAEISEEETAAILYTSGTTGKPKGAMLAHMNIVHSAMHYEAVLKLSADDRLIVAVPLSHVTGLVALMATALRCAATLVIMPEFKAPAFLALAARERMTYTLMVPAMYNLCLIQANCGQHDLSSWRIGAFGGAIMPEATIASVAKAWPQLTLVNVYGATETSSPATIMPPGAGAHRPESVGMVVPCGEMMVMDEAGREVPRGAAGELWVRGPMVVTGYWNNPDATRDSFVSGFWKSGDIGAMDADGFVSVFDRKKDMINRGGFKIYASEVENVLCRHPAVFEAAVLGKPCPVLGERVHAFVVLNQQDVAAADLKAFCAARLADYQVPESFTLTQTPLPRNANGKMLKRALRIEGSVKQEDDRKA